jgi:hypothetical protein
VKDRFGSRVALLTGYQAEQFDCQHRSLGHQIEPDPAEMAARYGPPV